MAWLNFNDSLNTLKGQITNFLTDEDGAGTIFYNFTLLFLIYTFLELTQKTPEYEELRKICLQQEQEVSIDVLFCQDNNHSFFACYYE